MFRQFFSIKRTAGRVFSIFPPVLLFICSVFPLTAESVIISDSGIVRSNKYIGESLELLSEKAVFEQLNQMEELPEDFQNLLLSGDLGADPDINVAIGRGRNGVYNITLSYFGSDEQTVVNWGIEDVLKESVSKLFRPVEDEIPLLDFTEHAYWFRLPLSNVEDSGIGLVLELDKNIYSWFDLIYLNGHEYISLNGSYEAPMSKRLMQDSKILLPFELPPGEHYIYLRMDHRLVDTVPIRLWTTGDFSRKNNRDKFLHGFISGTTMLLFAYALFLAFSLKEGGYFYLALLIFAGYLVHISESGLGMTFFWPEHPMMSIFIFSIALPLTIIVNLIFCRHYLNIQSYARTADRIISSILIAAGGLIITQFFVPITSRFVFTGIALVLDYLSVIPLLYAVTVLYRREKKGRRSSLFILAAVGFQLISYIEYWLSRFNIIPLGMIDFLHLRSIGFALVMFGGVRFKLNMMENIINSLRTRLDKIIAEKLQGPGRKSLTDKTTIKVEAVKVLIEKNFNEPLYRDELAASVGLSRDHLGRMFKLMTGEKISDYLNRLRVEEACRRLKGSSSRIIDIAFDVGFENLRTFNLCFSKYTGMPPSEYRRQYGKVLYR